MSATWVMARALPFAFISIRPITVFTSLSSRSGPTSVAFVTSAFLSIERSRCLAAEDSSPTATSTPHPVCSAASAIVACAWFAAGRARGAVDAVAAAVGSMMKSELVMMERGALDAVAAAVGSVVTLGVVMMERGALDAVAAAVGSVVTLGVVLMERSGGRGAAEATVTSGRERLTPRPFAGEMLMISSVASCSSRTTGVIGGVDCGRTAVRPLQIVVVEVGRADPCGSRGGRGSNETKRKY